MNKTTAVLTDFQYHTIIAAMKEGSYFFKPNPKIRACLIAQANLGMRIGDILSLTMDSIYLDGEQYRYKDFKEQKTGKPREFLIPTPVYQFLKNYCEDNKIAPDQIIFPTTEQNINAYLRRVCAYLEFENIGTHSFRKKAVQAVYEKDYDIFLAQEFAQHSTTETTKRYLHISSERMNKAIKAMVDIPQ